MNPEFYYTCNGFIIHDLSEVPENGIVRAFPRLLGGKGGFGSMLRAIGSQIEKTTNKEMCRDLNGRRMRDVNSEKRLKEWLDKADERKREKIEAYLVKRRKRQELLKNGPSTDIRKEGRTIEEHQQLIARELQSAIAEAFEKHASKASTSNPSNSEKKCLNLGIDSDLDSISTSSEENDILMDKPVSPISVIAEKTDQNKVQDNNISEEPKSKKPKIDEIIPETSKIETKEELKPEIFDDIDLESIGSVHMLLTLGPEQIKYELSNRGLKCGGSLMERAQRLYSVKGLKPDEYPPNLIAGSLSAGTKRRRARK